jgi:hypothetical protein
MSKRTYEQLQTDVQNIATDWREKPHHLLGHAAAKTLEQQVAEAYELGIQTGRNAILSEFALHNAGVVINDLGLSEESYDEPVQASVSNAQKTIDYDETNGQTRFDIKEIA